MQPVLMSPVLDPVSGLLLPVSDLKPGVWLAPDSDSVSVPDLVLVLGSEFHPYKQL